VTLDSSSAIEAIEGHLERLQKDGLPFPISEDEHRDIRREPITVTLATAYPPTRCRTPPLGCV
jgi:hypothetical protein